MEREISIEVEVRRTEEPKRSPENPKFPRRTPRSLNIAGKGRLLPWGGGWGWEMQG